MDIIFNDCSIHEQFPDRTSFFYAFSRIMHIRSVIRKRFGSEIRCHRNVVNAYVMPGVTIPRALNNVQRQAVMQWLSRGPFWDDERRHDPGDWLDSNGEIITDTGLGEAAYCRLFLSTEHRVVSLDPSSWLIDPLPAYWRESDDRPVESVEIPNYWDLDTLLAALAADPVLLNSWEDLARIAHARCFNLTFSPDSFEPLNGYPFGRGPAQRLLRLLEVLHDLKDSFGDQGAFNEKGLWMLDQYFSGKKSWFSDSSPREKSKFAKDLSFPHPTIAGKTLSCTWHGKIKTPQLRIHFSWPIRAEEPLYIAYVGPKITKT